MKTTLTTGLALIAANLLWSAPAFAQDDEARQVELQKKFDRKMEKPFIAHGKWLTDYDQARKLAKQEGKLLFVYFTRSYAP